MNDTLITGMAADNQVRFFCSYAKELTETARTLHNTSPVATAALGRLLTAGAMMGNMCKNASDVLTLQIRCDGPIGGLLVTSNAQSEVKGYVHNPDVMLPPNSIGKLDVGGALGNGTLSVIKDIGLKEPYVGQTALTSGEIAEDLTYYFATSEQIPTSVALGVLMNKDNTVRHAGGFIIQLLPFAQDKLITDLEDRLNNFSSITKLMDNGMTPTDIINELFKDYSINFTNSTTPCYKCDCSKERTYKAVMSIGKAEIEKIIDDKEPIDVECHFCKKSYHFDIDELKTMIS
ncbi:MAG: Hsp33 family molecular chaperone HslO [Lachnospiraceae bacterium]|nr:Hsp33 family molecular chaperone HslO [Lachnospiraceae bacterium]